MTSKSTNIVTIENITLIGTAHVSKASVQEVKKTIETLKPRYVCIELDEERFQNMQNTNKWENTDIVEIIKNKKMAPLLMQIIMGAFQSRFAKDTKSEAGAEFKMASEKANEINAELILIDRNIKVTLNRIWRKVSFWQKSKLISEIAFGNDELKDVGEEKLQELMNDDILEASFSALNDELPIIHEVLITERNEYMANNILNIQTDQQIIAVVGKGHLKGIAEQISQKKNTHRNKELDIIPNKSISSKILSNMFPVLIIGLIAASFVFGDYNVGMDQLKQWILWNSSLAAIFTLLARGSFISAIVAGLTAPIGAISPALSVGIFVAFSEAIVKKPTVNDMANIFEDTSSIKTILNNKFLKIIVLFFVSSLGGAIGNIIGGSQLIKNLFF